MVAAFGPLRNLANHIILRISDIMSTRPMVRRQGTPSQKVKMEDREVLDSWLRSKTIAQALECGPRYIRCLMECSASRAWRLRGSRRRASRA
jgi:hypothetical protein